MNQITKTAEEAYQKGNRLLMHNNVQEAVAAYSEAINSEPDVVEFRLARGRCFLSLALYESALDDFKVAAETNPESSLAQFGIGRCHHCLGHPVAAMLSYNCACRLNPDFQAAFISRQSLLQELGRRLDPKLYKFTHRHGAAVIFNAWSSLYGNPSVWHHGIFKSEEEWQASGKLKIDAFLREEPSPHWHYVSCGLSEFVRDQSDTNQDDGLGFEFSMRVKRDSPDQKQPPLWPANLFQREAEYLRRTGNYPEHGETIQREVVGSTIGALLLLLDPLIPALDTKNGRIKFLAFYGLTRDELEAVRAWRSDPFIDFVRKQNELLIVDPFRLSILKDPVSAEHIRKGIESAGSSVRLLYDSCVSWTTRKVAGKKTVEVKLPFNEVKLLSSMIPGRILRGEPFTFKGVSQSLVLCKGLKNSWKIKGSEVRVSMNNLFAHHVSESVQEEKTSYSWDELPGLTILT